MNDIWYEEELLPLETSPGALVKSSGNALKHLDTGSAGIIDGHVYGIIRVNRPRWRVLTEEETSQILTWNSRSTLYFVRLGFQFDLSKQAKDDDYRFVEARCSGHLFPAHPHQPQPIVNQVIPKDYYGDTQHTSSVSVKLGLSVEFGPVKANLGEVTGNIFVGELEPEIIGWSGSNECEPYWELHPVSKSLRGERHLWMIIEMPEGCRAGAELALQAEGLLESRLFGVIPVGPRIREIEKRKRMLIR